MGLGKWEGVGSQKYRLSYENDGSICEVDNGLRDGQGGRRSMLSFTRVMDFGCDVGRME